MKFEPGQSGNPAGRPKGSVSKQLTALRAAAEAVLPLVLARALGGDASAQELLLKMGMPRLKAVEIPIEFALPTEGETFPIRAVLQQAADGELPVSSAKQIVSTLMPLVEQEATLMERAKNPPSAMVGSNAYLHGLLQQSG